MLRRNVNVSSREARDWSGDGSARRSSSLPFGAVDRLSSFSRRLSSKAFDEALPVLTSVSFFSDGRGKECSSPVPHFFHFRRQNARRGPRRNCRLVVVQEKRNLIYFVVLFCFAFLSEDEAPARSTLARRTRRGQACLPPFFFFGRARHWMLSG